MLPDELPSRCRDACLNRGLAPDGEILSFTGSRMGTTARMQEVESRRERRSRAQRNPSHGAIILMGFTPCSSESLRSRQLLLALLNHRDVANAENAGAVFCLPPASVQSYPSYPFTLPIGFGESSGVRRGKRDLVRATASAYGSIDLCYPSGNAN